MDVNKFVENLFNREQELVYVGVVDNRYTVLASETRKGARIYLTAEGLRNFVQLAPLIIMETLERLQSAIGLISSVLIRYEKRVFLFSRFEDMVIVLGFETTVPTPFPDTIAKIIKEAASQLQ